MKRLLVLRHAKSSWKDVDLEDHDRPLSKRGKHDAPRMGRVMRDEGILPQLAICSTAKRARVTLKRVLEAAQVTCEVRLAPELYMAGPHEIVELLRVLPDQLVQVLVVGHNPGMEELVQQLTGETVTLPTAALAVVDCDCKRWPQLALRKTALLVQLWKPKDLADEPPDR